MSINIYNSNPNATSEEENFSRVADRGSKLASDTIYSNTTSGLNSVNVQGAIDEINTKVEDNADKITRINSDLTASTISVTNGTNRQLQVNNVKKVGNVCYVSLAFGMGASSYPVDYTLATLNNITANGRGYLIGYITNESTDISTRELYIESGSNALKIAEYGLNANYSMIVQGCFVTN